MTGTTLANAAGHPNIVLVMSDDQGYGDLGCHGNPLVRTPALDALYADSVRLTSFHVDPTCSPTRAALLTGRYSSRTGVWHTVMGRSLLRSDEIALSGLLAGAGYQTGIFGKWHLGDNPPSRPRDFGFREVLIHGGGGVGQTPDFWGNDYFDDTYQHNGQLENFAGYCTDVWFSQALEFIEENRNRPFFAYIPTNAAHSPFLVDEKYSRPYRDLGVPSPRAEFYGMVTNIDENIAKLVKRLDELQLTENTILIFMTDNGSVARLGGGNAYNAGMRGWKGSVYDGGHRVPCLIRFPGGNLTGGRDVSPLTAHIDLVPTLVELCGLQKPKDLHWDGASLVPLLNETSDWPERILFVHSQRIDHPVKWRQCAVMTDRLRLINGSELYDITSDPGQQQDLAADLPRVVASLRLDYEEWYSDISGRFGEYVAIALGDAQENPVTLTAMDWHAPIREIPWTHQQVERDRDSNGYWMVNVTRSGTYRIALRERPSYVTHQLQATSARLQLNDIEQEREVNEGDSAATFTVKLEQGETRLQTWLVRADGTSHGAYYVDVEYVD
jgi:arylsulfatase A-like enzyme